MDKELTRSDQSLDQESGEDDFPKGKDRSRGWCSDRSDRVLIGEACR